MHDAINLERYPIHDIERPQTRALIDECKAQLACAGMYSLDAFVRQAPLHELVAQIMPLFNEQAYTHKRNHNIYFQDEIAGLPKNHPALTRFDTVNHTVCADQIPNSLICNLYYWAPFIRFLAATVSKSRLYPMADALACANVMAYGEGEALNWHFDRAEFTITLLLQQPENGGNFEYRTDLRSEAEPNYDGVARLLAGKDDQIQTLQLVPGTLNVFKGRNTAHRVSPVIGTRPRMVAVFSYYEQADISLSTEEQLGFYGRASMTN